MSAAARRPRKNHLDLAQRILDHARQRGFRPGDRLPEQQMAELCNVSRTPIRAAFELLEGRRLVAKGSDAGYRLTVDLTARLDSEAALPSADEETLAAAVLRDRAARRLGETVTATELMRRYDSDRKTVLKAIKNLSDDDILERAPGQSWLFRPLPDSPEAISDSYAFRLVLEPAAVLAPGFALDGARAAALREGMEVLAARADSAFDTGEFQRLDLEFHGLIADGCANRFVADALAAHLRLRRLPGAIAAVNVFRLRQSTAEHLAILDNLESLQYEVAADLLRVHLRLSHSQRPQAANRGAPPLFGSIRR